MVTAPEGYMLVKTEEWSDAVVLAVQVPSLLAHVAEFEGYIGKHSGDSCRVITGAYKGTSGKRQDHQARKTGPATIAMVRKMACTSRPWESMWCCNRPNRNA